MAAIIDVSAKGNVDVLEVVVVSMQVSLRWLQGAFGCTESSPRDGDACVGLACRTDAPLHLFKSQI